jgi:small subunit ribosomal protein S17e
MFLLMDRIKRISTELLERYPDRFGIDFDENKKLIKEIAIVRSKILRNKIAGYITSRLRRQATDNEAAANSNEEKEKELEMEED